MKKIMSGLLLTGILLGTGTNAFAADLDTKEGTTKLEITDYTIDPDTGLPSDPGAFALNEVPNIDIGKHSLDSVAATNATFTGTYDKDLKVTDTRPTQDSIDSALGEIGKVVPNDKVTQEDINASQDKWTKAIAASPWKIDAKATVLSGIGTSLTIGSVEVLTASGTVVDEPSSAPVGTKAYELKEPVLTIANNNLSIQTYNGTITYSAVNAL
ncbi:hypothetical protein JZO76_02865 [Enterococcus sp. MJM12]|uniref:WxL domain-containing protein n=1 Tax=Candidatus Enterococcus myersii TaxID=2815322 RepID=A0ABS3H4S7_9ENTE|nr:hypothetical protein [Enterococcus sp. MJM12]MBO0448468.1 hypothetical protein [Enterococcus sp. MJM12]